MADDGDASQVQESQAACTPIDLNENDDSLDSFFKKKDKKGKKKKSKKSDKGTSGEDADTTKSKKRESDTKKDVETNAEGSAHAEQEEWIDFEDDTAKDYSDLKIQNFQAVEQSREIISVEVPEYDETGELIPPKADEGPWNKVAPVPQEQLPEPAKPEVVEPVKKVGAYRPPQARSGGSGITAAPLRRVRKQQAPEISNEMDFPSLSAASQDTVTHAGFEVVKTGVKSSTPWRSKHQQAQAQELKLGNQFSALNMSH